MNAVALMMAVAMCGDIVYTVEPYGAEGYHLSGTITTDGTLGQLTTSNFRSWNITLNGSTPALIDGTSPNLQPVVFGGVYATESEIYLQHGVYDEQTILMPFSQGQLQDHAGTHAMLIFTSASNIFGGGAWFSDSEPFGATVSAINVDPDRVAPDFRDFGGFSLQMSSPLRVASVPEPSAFLLVGIGTTLAAYGARRKRNRFKLECNRKPLNDKQIFAGLLGVRMGWMMLILLAPKTVIVSGLAWMLIATDTTGGKLCAVLACLLIVSCVLLFLSPVIGMLYFEE